MIFFQDHELIEMFWEVLKSFSLDNQKKFLKFVTGCSRGPLLGFQYLEPKFCIQRFALSACLRFILLDGSCEVFS